MLTYYETNTDHVSNSQISKSENSSMAEEDNDQQFWQNSTFPQNVPGYFPNGQYHPA
jgi:hypothetical protein